MGPGIYVGESKKAFCVGHPCGNIKRRKGTNEFVLVGCRVFYLSRLLFVHFCEGHGI